MPRECDREWMDQTVTCRESLWLSNARVQLRAVGQICALKVAIRRSEQALNRNDFLGSRARQLQRTLDGPLYEPVSRMTGTEIELSRAADGHHLSSTRLGSRARNALMAAMPWITK